MPQTIRLKREISVEKLQSDDDGVYEIAFSSETPVERQIDTRHGPQIVNEILLHSGPECADLERINNNASLLFNHNFDNHLGIVVPGSVRIDNDKVGRAKVKFSSVGQLAQEIKAKVDEGTISKISFGYDINEYDVVGDDMLVSRWAPYEISFVTVPADDKVGLGRSINKIVINTTKEKRMKRYEDFEIEDIVELSREELADMTIAEIEALAEDVRAKREELLEEVEDAEKAEKASDEADADADKNEGDNAEAKVEDKKAEGIEDELTAEEREEEIVEIEEIAERYKIGRGEVRKAIASGMTARQFKRSIKPSKNKKEIRTMTSIAKDTQKNLEARFDLAEVTRSLAAGKEVKGAAAEYSQEMTKRRMNAGRSINGRAYIPVSALQGQRAVNTVPTVANIEQHYVDYNSFVEMLLQPTAIGKLGVNYQTGLTTPYDVPKQTSSSVDAFGFVAENGDSPEGESGFDIIKFMPHTFTGGNPISRQALNTMPNLASYISNHIVEHSRSKIQALMFGSATDPVAAGANAPKSIIAQLVAKQIGMTYKEFVTLAAEAEGKGVAMDRFKYLIASALGGELKSTLRDAAVAGYIVDDANKLGGHDVVTSGLVKPGQIISGDFSAITVAEWEGLALDMDDTTYRNKGAIVPRVWCDIDWKVTADDRLFLFEKTV